MTNDSGTDPKGKLPAYAIFRGRKVRISWYEEGTARPFHIVDKDDSQRSVRREDLIFLKDTKSKTHQGSS